MVNPSLDYRMYSRNNTLEKLTRKKTLKRKKSIKCLLTFVEPCSSYRHFPWPSQADLIGSHILNPSLRCVCSLLCMHKPLRFVAGEAHLPHWLVCVAAQRAALARLWNNTDVEINDQMQELLNIFLKNTGR